MKKWNIYSIVVILIASILNNASAQSVILLKTTQLIHYPSASGIAFHDGKLYVMGDDATQLLVLNSEHTPVDSVTIFKYNEKRIHYSIKPDLESLTIGSYKRRNYLVATPSFSSSNRNTFYIFPLNDIHKYSSIVNPNPIKLLQRIGIKEANVEGSVIVGKQLIVSNRANLTQRDNYLISIPIRKRSLKKAKNWKKTRLLFPMLENTIGVSGLEYYPSTDVLLFTASTEATSSANADGEIGESYLGYLANFSKKNSNQQSPDKLINLSKELKIGNQKIEGLCIESFINNEMILHFVTDNDNGQSTLYKVRLTF